MPLRAHYELMRPRHGTPYRTNSFLSAFFLGRNPNLGYNTLAKAKRDGSGGQAMNLKNVPATFSSRGHLL